MSFTKVAIAGISSEVGKTTLLARPDKQNEMKNGGGNHGTN